MSSSKSIVLVDDHVVMCDGLRQLLELSGPYQIIAQYNNGQALIDGLPFIAKPDLIIMDLTMPVMGGEETVRKFNEKGFGYPIIVLTVNATDEAIIRLYKLGVRGYLEKDCATANLLKAIDDVLSTGSHHNALLTRALVSEARTKGKNSREKVMECITPRELEFLRLVCDDSEYTYDQISSEMSISIRTVDGYRQSLFEKFDIKSKTGLVLFAIKNRLAE